MELKCERERLSGHDDTPVLGFQIYHDAIAAHALMQAMGDCPSLSLECKAITARADELMQEWTK